jgi:hypothetical protein
VSVEDPSEDILIDENYRKSTLAGQPHTATKQPPCYNSTMASAKNNIPEYVLQGTARNHNDDEVTFIVASDPIDHDWRVATSSGERAERLGKGAYFFNGKQYETDDPLAP